MVTYGLVSVYFIVFVQVQVGTNLNMKLCWVSSQSEFLCIYCAMFNSNRIFNQKKYLLVSSILLGFVN